VFSKRHKFRGAMDAMKAISDGVERVVELEEA